MLEREAKLEKYYGPKGEWKRREHRLEWRMRIKIDRHSRPRIKSPRGLESLSRIILLSYNI
jgi:hypothetical protein